VWLLQRIHSPLHPRPIDAAEAGMDEIPGSCILLLPAFNVQFPPPRRVPVPSILRILPFALLAAFAPAVPLGAQGFVYRDIAWGSDFQTTTRQLEAEGYRLEEDYSPDEGEVVYTNPENEAVLAMASFAGDRLVGIRIVVTSDNVNDLFLQTLQEWFGSVGYPDEVEKEMAAWHREGTTFSVTLGETDSGLQFVAAQYAGPGYEEEIQRRIDAASQPVEYPELDERWVVALERPLQRTAFDRATVQAMGSRVFRVWLRDDYAQLQVDPVDHDMELHQMDYDCGARRFRIGAATYQLRNQLVHTDTPSEPSEWIPIPPESVGEQIITALCRVAERR
jgi:hypothetical protein